MNILNNYDVNFINKNNKIENIKSKYNSSTKFSIDSEVVDNKDSRETEKKRLKEVSQDFEALMINQMLKEMRKTVNKSELINGGVAEEIFEDMLYDEYAKEFSKTKSFGLAETIYNQMEKYI